LYRRGHRRDLPTLTEERFLDGAILETLRATGAPGRIAFDDPDAVVVVETVGDRAGLALWGRDDLRRYPFLHVD
jgi:tRNA(Ser,Leu) C12 N-acetylase TAN1